jgi:hypothetical protein
MAEALLKGEEAELVRKAIELAKAGNVPMLTFLLGRLLPKERSVRIDLPPMHRADDAIDRLGAIIDAVAAGQIAPSEGSALGAQVMARARIMQDLELSLRLNDIEKRQVDIQHAVEKLQEQRW